MTLKTLHRWNAAALSVFLTAHLLNHAVLLIGRENHLAVMKSLRQVYRAPWIEAPALVLFALQIGLGVALVLSRGWPRGRWAWAQVLSGLYLAVFLLQHVGATLAARASFDFETTTYFAAAVVSASPFVWYFFPYYVLGVTALLVHIAAALRFRVWPEPARVWHSVLAWGGLVFGLAIVTALSWGSAAELPAANQAYLDSLIPW